MKPKLVINEVTKRFCLCSHTGYNHRSLRGETDYDECHWCEWQYKKGEIKWNQICRSYRLDKLRFLEERYTRTSVEESV